MEPIWGEMNVERIKGRSITQLLVESELPLPAGRDAQRLLHAQGKIQNNSARCTNGRILAEGTITLQLLCVDNEQQPFGMRASTQYNHDIPLADVTDGMRASVKSQILDLRCTLRDRRIHLEAVAELNAMAEHTERMRVLSDIANEENVQKLYTEQQIGQMTHVGGGTLRLREEIPASGVQQLLIADAEAQIKNAVPNDSGIAVNGVLFISALYMDESGALNQHSNQLPFEEFITVEQPVQNCVSLGVTPQVNDFTLLIGETEGMIDVETSLSLEASCISNTQINALSDVYVPNGCCCCKQEMVERISPVKQIQQNCTVHESVRIPEGMPDAFRVTYVTARPTVLGVIDQEGMLAVDGLLITCVVYQTDEGVVTSFEEDIPFRCAIDAVYMVDSDVRVHTLEAHGSGSGRLVNCVFTLETCATLRELRYIPLAMQMEPAEPEQRDNGILIYYASAGETLWDIGKRFGVTTAQLQTWNPGKEETFMEGEPLLILSAAGKHKG